LFIQRIPVIEKEKERKQTDRRFTTRSYYTMYQIYESGYTVYYSYLYNTRTCYFNNMSDNIDSKL